MKKGFNWGHGITVFYLIFVAAVVSVLIASFSVDHSLVADDYYAKDLAYQEQYNKAKKYLDAKQGDVKVKVLSEEESLEIYFSSSNAVEGKVHFYRPSDQRKDFTVEIVEKEIKFSTLSLERGNWILKIEWIEAGETYYCEHKIYLI